MWNKQSEDVGPQRILGVLTKDREVVSTATYREAVDVFAKEAAMFLEHVAIMSKARDAYEQAVSASAELRQILDTGDHTLQTLWAQMEQAVNVVLHSPPSERKRGEPAKVEPIRASDEDTDTARVLP
jgi:hypothetical protein